LSSFSALREFGSHAFGPWMKSNLRDRRQIVTIIAQNNAISERAAVPPEAAEDGVARVLAPAAAGPQTVGLALELLPHTPEAGG
jgi:hypothetical protein